MLSSQQMQKVIKQHGFFIFFFEEQKITRSNSIEDVSDNENNTEKLNYIFWSRAYVNYLNEIRTFRKTSGE